MLVTKAKMPRPPCSRKIKVNNTSTAPVTISATAPAVDSAPLVTLAWFSCSALITASPAWSI